MNRLVPLVLSLFPGGFLCAQAPLPVLPPVRQIAPPANVRALFRPQQDLESAVVTAINQAKSEILVNQVAISSKAIATALVNAYQVRKVVVAIILDAHPPIRNYEGFAFLTINHVPYLISDSKGKNNHKYAIIDRRIVLVGSYDWFASAPNNNEDLLVLDEPGLASVYANNWFEEAQRGIIPDAEKLANP